MASEPVETCPTVGGLRALLIDLDGVLRRWEGQPGTAETAFGLEPGAIAQVAFEPELLEEATLGRFTDENWRRRIVDRLALTYGRQAAAGAVAAWSAPMGTVDEHVLALVRAVRARAPVCLVTNATTRLERDLDALGLLHELDAVVSSARLGARKPDARI